ncbi:EF-hand domain-containing protein [Hyphobacterium sp.]|uniref:EF-hand domain-containing protein n=1 Tax=Hyphobacterium sp. TaxID=2004662 RepID=UPI003BAA678D
MKSSLVIAGLAGVMVFAATADAQHRGQGRHGPERAMMMLRAADANGDNNITLSEVQALQADMFEWMDRNGDGVLSRADRSPVHQRLAAIREAEGASESRRERRRARRGQQRDTNGDGQISREEFLGGENRIFERLDANNDSVITPDELDAAVENARERRESRRFWWRE